MKIFTPILRLILTILGLLAGGCSADFTATRGGETFHVQIKPAAEAADPAQVKEITE